MKIEELAEQLYLEYWSLSDNKTSFEDLNRDTKKRWLRAAKNIFRTLERKAFSPVDSPDHESNNEIGDLWPQAFAKEAIITPAAILKAQAGYLGQHTKNLLEGEVKAYSPVKEGNIAYNFYIIAPCLDHYKYKLLTISHSLTSFYPLYFRPFAETNHEDVETVLLERDFTERLRQLFDQVETRNIISALLAQSQ